jgi:hypothetical protein
MEFRDSDLALQPTFGDILYRLVVAILARASLVLVACMMVGILSDRGVAPYLATAGWCFGFVAAFMVGHALRAERGASLAEAGDHYALAFLNYGIAFVAFVAFELVGTATPA